MRGQIVIIIIIQEGAPEEDGVHELRFLYISRKAPSIMKSLRCLLLTCGI